MRNFNKIESYINSKMTAAETEAYEKEIANNKELALEVELQRLENNAIEHLAFDLLKKEIAVLDHEENSNQKKHKEKTAIKTTRPRYKALLFATAIAVLLISSYLLSKNNFFTKASSTETPTQVNKETPIKEEIKSQPNSEEKTLNPPNTETRIAPIEKPKPKAATLPNYANLAMAAQPTGGDSNNLRGNLSDEIDSDWKVLLQKFNAQKYVEAITLADEMSPNHQFYVDARQLKAESLFHNSNFSAAAKIYTSLLEVGDEFQVDSYEYGLLRCHVSQLPATKSSVDKLFNSILSNPDHSHIEDARKLKSQLTTVGY